MRAFERAKTTTEAPDTFGGMPVPADQAEAAEQFAARLRTLRHRQGLTQAIVARATGVRVATWRAWERGTSLPLVTRIPKIAAALVVGEAELFVPRGSAFIASVFVGPESLERIRREGRPAAEDVAVYISRQLVPALANARPLLDNVPVGLDVRRSTGRRRSRAEVLALDRKRLEEGVRLLARRAPPRLPSYSPSMRGKGTNGVHPARGSDSQVANPLDKTHPS